MPKVSIIVPVYGVEKYITKCLDSIVNQTYKDFEIIIVDDETKDNSIRIIEENYHDKRIKIYHKKNGGSASAKNYGITKATGEYLMFVDSDDFISLDCLQKMFEKIEKDNVDLVICDYYKLEENGEKEHRKMIPHYQVGNPKCSVIAVPGPWGKLMRTSIIKENEIKFLDNHCFEDNAIMPFACALYKNFSYVEEPLYYYLQRSGSALNKSVYDLKWEDIFDSLEHLYQQFKKKNMLNEFYQEVEYIYIEYLLHAPSLRFLSFDEGIHNIKKISKILHEKFPNWKKNKYYKMENIKYKIICTLFYHNCIKLVKILLKK